MATYTESTAFCLNMSKICEDRIGFFRDKLFLLRTDLIRKCFCVEGRNGQSRKFPVFGNKKTIIGDDGKRIIYRIEK